MNFASKNVLIYDNGLFVSWAERLAETFGHVKYFMPWKNGFPKSNSLIVGSGIKGVERVHNFFDHVEDADLIVFPDVYDGDLQEYLRSHGKRVWGGGKGEEMELDRWSMKKVMLKLGMPVNETVKIIGLGKLREYLKENNDKWIKLSATRGDGETWHHNNYQLSEPRLDEWEYALGAKKHIMEFIVESSIPDASEIGYDGWCIDGKFPQENSLCGIEIKDVGYAGAIMPYKELPKEAQWVNEKLAPLLEKFGYRGFWSTEIRITKDGKSFMIDPCCRCGSPPNELYQEMYSNFDEVLWFGAEGQIVEPKKLATYGILAMIHSSWADKNWQAIHFPPEISRWIKIRNKCVINGMTYAVPQAVGLPEIGAVVGMGETLEEAIQHVVDRSQQVKGYYIDIKLDAVPKAMDEIRKAEKDLGMHFSSQPVPSPEAIAQIVQGKEGVGD